MKRSTVVAERDLLKRADDCLSEEIVKALRLGFTNLRAEAERERTGTGPSVVQAVKLDSRTLPIKIL
jgi:hypothetical protein